MPAIMLVDIATPQAKMQLDIATAQAKTQLPQMISAEDSGPVYEEESMLPNELRTWKLERQQHENVKSPAKISGCALL